MPFLRPILLSLCLASTVGWARDLGTYQIILDKKLLGSDRIVAPPVVSPPPEAPRPGWSRDYRMTMISKDLSTGVVRVGLQHLRDKSALLLIQGKDRYADFELISVNVPQSSAEIAYRGAAHRFELEKGPESASSRPDAGNRTPTPAEAPSTRRIVPRLNQAQSPRPGSTGASSELQIRRFPTREALDAHLNEQQMDAIRTGKPPLPIPLTPEMDDQLVQEGVLPPRDGP